MVTRNLPSRAAHHVYFRLGGVGAFRKHFASRSSSKSTPLLTFDTFDTVSQHFALWSSQFGATRISARLFHHVGCCDVKRKARKKFGDVGCFGSSSSSAIAELSTLHAGNTPHTEQGGAHSPEKQLAAGKARKRGCADRAPRSEKSAARVREKEKETAVRRSERISVCSPFPFFLYHYVRHSSFFPL